MNIKGILTFTAGAVVGSLATYYIVREGFRKQADEEIEQVREVYRRRDENDLEDNKIHSESQEELIEYYVDRIRELGGDVRIKEEDEDDEDDDREEVNPVEYSDVIEEITESEFMNGFEDYESTCITLYLKDETYLDETEEFIDDPVRYIGNAKITKPGTTYYIDHAMMMKIEVEAVDLSYKRDVIGEVDEDDESIGDFAD